MSQSTPADLAIAFRSLPRRLREASIGNINAAAVAATTNTVDGAIRAAAGVMKCDSTIEVLALAIEQRRLVDWIDADLHQLRSHATTAGTAIRALHDQAETGR
jgi:hypothetical protein